MLSLNDLHKAAGGLNKKRPALWLANASTQELMYESEKSGYPDFNVTRGRNGGTYFTRELVYAYAMWISPLFNLKVIRAYDSLVIPAPTQANPEPKALMSPAEMLLAQCNLIVGIEKRQDTQELVLERPLKILNAT